jgi:hypothetical protein
LSKSQTSLLRHRVGYLPKKVSTLEKLILLVEAQEMGQRSEGLMATGGQLNKILNYRKSGLAARTENFAGVCPPNKPKEAGVRKPCWSCGSTELGRALNQRKGMCKYLKVSCSTVQRKGHTPGKNCRGVQVAMVREKDP